MLPTIFFYKHFSQNKVIQVCLFCLALLLLLFCYFSRLAASSNFVTAVDIVSGFFLPVGFVHDSDYYSPVKILLLRADLSVYQFDVICISKSFSEFSKVLGNQNFEIEWYNLVRSYQSSTCKLGGV